MTALQQAPRRTLRAPVAYRVRLANGGTLVLCQQHVDLLRLREEPRAVRFTGATFAVELCDHCHPERT